MALGVLSSLATDAMGYSVAWSPFFPSRFAVATSQHFGVIGGGKLYVFDDNQGQFAVAASFDSADSLFDCAWSESNAACLVTAHGGDGVRLWDLSSKAGSPRLYAEHSAEVYAVDWNLISKDVFVSGAWDKSVKVWHPERPGSLRTFLEHSGCVYSTRWSPHRATSLASAAGDGLLKIWDTNMPTAAATIRAHNTEVLTCDWNKYNPNVIVTGSVDRSIRVWDIRTNRLLQVLNGHEFAVRRVKCSPHHESIIASASYDTTFRVWDIARGDQALVQTYDQHSEFVLGVDFNLFHEGRLATCAWDNRVLIVQVSEPRSPDSLPGR